MSEKTKKLLIKAFVLFLLANAVILYNKFTYNKPSYLIETTLNQKGAEQEFQLAFSGVNEEIGLATYGTDVNKGKYDGNYTVEFIQNGKIVDKHICNIDTLKGKSLFTTTTSHGYALMPIDLVQKNGLYTVKVVANRPRSSHINYAGTLYFYKNKQNQSDAAFFAE
ncbi:hypothetical protein ACFLR3_04085 [Campylobacterota bacterium]